MRTTTFTFISLLLATLTGFSQNQIQFTDATARWYVADTYPNTTPQNPGFIETTTKVYGTMGDTVIGSEIWKRMYHTPDSTFASGHTYLGSVREENGFVLFRDAGNALDTLYNFNLQVGDSIDFGFTGVGSMYLSVIQVDSISINNQYHKRFHFERYSQLAGYLEDVWIEGIGSVHGPLFTLSPRLRGTEIPDSINVTCYKQSGAVLWDNSDFSECYVQHVLSSSEVYEEQFQIFPNPVDRILNISFLGDVSINNIDIYDITSKKVLILDKDARSFDLSELETGIYFIIADAERQKMVKQIVVK